MKIWIVVCSDRHCDDMITVHSSREGADQQIEAFKGFCDSDTYAFVERSYGQSAGWVRYVETFDDGPHALIAESELKL